MEHKHSEGNNSHESHHNEYHEDTIEDKHKKRSGASKIFGLLKRRTSSKKITSPIKNANLSPNKMEAEDFRPVWKEAEYVDNIFLSSSKDIFINRDLNDNQLSKKEKKKLKKEFKRRSEKASKGKLKIDKSSPKRSISESNVSGIDLLLKQSKADSIPEEDLSSTNYALNSEPTTEILTPKPVELPPKVSLKDFRVIKLIGKGGFGEVYLVEHIAKKKKLALKVLDKKHIASTKKAQCILNERDVLVKGKITPFLMHLSYSWQDEKYLYLAMKYCPGGDLRSLLSAIGPFEEDEARLYMAEMVLAVDSLHNMGYIHRDLKPDNFLIDKRGHIVLADFGLSTENGNILKPLEKSSIRTKTETRHIRAHSILLGEQELEELNKKNFNLRFTRTRSNALLSDPSKPSRPSIPRYNPNLTNAVNNQTRKAKAYSIVGSPEYMSPEILSESGYSKEVDWWSLGCIFFELLLGDTPFSGETPEEVFENVSNWKTVIPQVLGQYKEYFSESCFDLISKLICGRESRLGKTGIDEIKNHPFFANLNWDNIREEIPPFIPKLEGDEDTSYFDDNIENIEQELLPKIMDKGSVVPTRKMMHYKDFTHDESVQIYDRNEPITSL